MSHDISQSISQRSSREKDQENHRIQQIGDELKRRCQLHETQSGNSESNVSIFEIEQREAESMAKENSYWIPMNNVFSLGVPGPSGNENDTYIKNNTIFKVNNLLNSQGICNLFNKIILHNTIFPETFYYFYGITGYDGRSIFPIFKQDLIKNAVPATTIEIETYMAAIGFTKENNEGSFSNDDYIVWDIVPRNVLKDVDGDLYVIDAEIKYK